VLDKHKSLGALLHSHLGFNSQKNCVDSTNKIQIRVILTKEREKEISNHGPVLLPK
jgi:hypothetical protein